VHSNVTSKNVSGLAVTDKIQITVHSKEYDSSMHEIFYLLDG